MGMFPGLSRKEAEVAAREKGYEPSWLRDGSLRLSHVVGSPFRAHPSDGAEAWHSHLTNLHVTTAWAAELGKAARHLKAPSYVLRSLVFSALYGSGLAEKLLHVMGSEVGAKVVEAETGAEVVDVEYVRALWTSSRRRTSTRTATSSSSTTLEWATRVTPGTARGASCTRPGRRDQHYPSCARHRYLCVVVSARHALCKYTLN